MNDDETTAKMSKISIEDEDGSYGIGANDSNHSQKHSNLSDNDSEMQRYDTYCRNSLNKMQSLKTRIYLSAYKKLTAQQLPNKTENKHFLFKCLMDVETLL